MESGPVSDSFLRSIRIQPFKKEMYAAAAGRLSWDVLGKMFLSLGRTDRLLKSSRLDPLIHLEQLCDRVVRLISGSGGESGLPGKTKH